MPRYVRGVEQSTFQKEYNQDRLRLTFEVVEANYLPSHRLGNAPSTYVTIEALSLRNDFNMNTLLSGNTEFKPVEHIFRTQLVKHTKSPAYNKRFAIFPASPDEVMRISIHDKGFVTGDVLIATCDLQLDSLDLKFQEDIDIWISLKPSVQSEEERDPELRLIMTAENFGQGYVHVKYEKNNALISFAQEVLETIKDSRYNFVQEAIPLLERRINEYIKNPKPRGENVLASFMRGYIETIEAEGVKFKSKENCKNLFV